MFRVLLAALLVAAAPFAVAQKYPSRTVEVVVPYAPGGGTDNLMRMITGIIDENKWSPMALNVNNRAGGSGAVGFNYLINKKGDSHVIAGATPIGWGMLRTERNALRRVQVLHDRFPGMRPRELGLGRWHAAQDVLEILAIFGVLVDRRNRRLKLCLADKAHGKGDLFRTGDLHALPLRCQSTKMITNIAIRKEMIAPHFNNLMKRV
jgi:hypothetical protein